MANKCFEIGKKGFSLLEVLLATLLVSVGIFALMEAFNRGVFGVGEVEDYALALSLTQEKMEEIQDTAKLNFAKVDSEAKAAVKGFSDFQREVSVKTVDPILKEVLVITYWTVPKGENSVRFSTRVVNN